jgi:hypothetical protein
VRCRHCSRHRNTCCKRREGVYEPGDLRKRSNQVCEPEECRGNAVLDQRLTPDPVTPYQRLTRVPGSSAIRPIAIRGLCLALCAQFGTTSGAQRLEAGLKKQKGRLAPEVGEMAPSLTWSSVTLEILDASGGANGGEEASDLGSQVLRLT